MKRTIRVNLRRVLSFTLFLCMTSQIGVPAFAAAEKQSIYLPAAEIPQEIRDGSLFYIGTPSAELDEGADAVYLLPVGRGGDVSGPASVTLKFSDVTARYGEDYLVRFRGQRPADPPDNSSLLEIIMDGEVEENPLPTDEELAALEEELALLAEPIEPGEPIELEEPIEPEEPQALEEYTIDAEPEAEETQSPGNPIKAAKELYSGGSAAREPMTLSGDMITELQTMADFITTNVVGATLTVPFGPGESLLYVEIEPLDNGEPDGSRSFMVMLSEGGGGTNSALANALFTIGDDEAFVPAEIFFDESVYEAENGEASVTIRREGAMTQAVTAKLMTLDNGSAVAGRNYAPVNAEVFFPFGVGERTLTVPVSNDGLSGGGSFRLSLTDPSGAVVTGSEASVNIPAAVYAAQADPAASQALAAPVTPAATALVLGTDLKTGAAAKRYAPPINLNKAFGSNVTIEPGWSEEDIKLIGWKWDLKTSGGLSLYARIRDKKTDKYIAGIENGVSLPLGSSPTDYRYDYNGVRLTYGLNYRKEEKEWDIDDDDETSINTSRYFMIHPYGFSFTNATFTVNNSKATEGVEHYVEYNFVPDDPNFMGRRQKDMYFATSAATASVFLFLRMYALNKNWSAGGQVDIYSVEPIKRPFNIRLVQAEPLTFIKGGSRQTWPELTQSVIDGENGAMYSAVTRFGGDKVSISHYVDKVIADAGVSKATKLIGLKLISPTPDTLPDKVIFPSSTGSDRIEFTLDNSFLTQHAKYIRFSGYYEAPANITIQPVYGYEDVTVRVRRDNASGTAASRGYLIESYNETLGSGSRVNYNVPTSSQYIDLKFHKGDQLNFKTFMNDAAKAGYIPDGFSVIRREINQNSPIFDSKTHHYFATSNTSAYNALPLLLEKGFYELTPTFKANTNRVTIRVPTGDVAKLDTTFGVLGTAERQSLVSGYTDFVIRQKDGVAVLYGQRLPLSARLARGANQVPLAGSLRWREILTQNTIYSGDTFYYEVKDTAQDNVIYLSVDQTSAARWYVLKGALFYRAKNLFSNTGLAPTVPVEGGIVIAGSATGAVGARGEFETSPFRAVNGTMFRYMVAANGFTSQNSFKIGSLPQSASTVARQVSVMDERGSVVTQTVQATVIDVSSNSYLSPSETVTAEFTATMLELNGVRHSTPTVPLNNPDSPTQNDEARIVVRVSDNVLYEAPGVGEARETVQRVVFSVRKRDDPRTVIREFEGVKDGFYSDVWSFTFRPFTTEGYSSGDLIYVQMYTNRITGVPQTDPNTGMRPSPELIQAMTVSAYAPVPTGMALSENPVPPPVEQEFMLPSMSSTLTDAENRKLDLPLIGNLDASFGIGAITFSATYDTETQTTVLSFGASVPPGEEEESDTGGPTPPQSASFGSPSWEVVPVVGMYLEFSHADIVKKDGTVVKPESPVLIGGGIYLGVDVNYQLSWYTVLPVVFIPVYVGVSGNLNTTLETSFGVDRAELLYQRDMTQKLDLKRFMDMQTGLSASTSIYIYGGIGIDGLLGVKGGLEVDGELAWSPAAAAADSFGMRLGVNAKFIFEIIIFSLTFNFKLADTGFGSFAPDARAAAYDAPYDAQARVDLDDMLKLRTFEGDPSGWMPVEPRPLAGFIPSGETALLRNGYDNPDPQILSFGENDYLMAFVGRDPARGPYDTTVLQYSVFDGSDRYGEYEPKWSQPVTVQNDGTGDFEPHLTDLGDRGILITWMSKNAVSVGAGELEEFTGSMEIYTAIFDKTTRTLGPIERLTDDAMYDYAPKAVYDPASGDVAVYYLKAAPFEGDALEFIRTMDSTSNDCDLVYRLYDGARGECVRDRYYPNELSDPSAAQDLIDRFGGQRFVLSPVPGNPNPLIVDFTAASHNGYGIYAFTVDGDNDKATAADRKLYLQFYEFASHKTFAPVEVPESLSAGNPQLVANSAGDAAYLFWAANGEEILYIDIGDILFQEDAPDADGPLNSGFDSATGTPLAGLSASRVEIYPADRDAAATGKGDLASYKAHVSPRGDLYLVWQGFDEFSNDPDGYSIELYATALVSQPTTTIPSVPEGALEAEDGGAAASNAWAPVNALLGNGYHNREHSFAVSKLGNMMIVHNKYLQTLTENEAEPVEIRDVTLTATLLQPENSLEVRNIQAETQYPMPGDRILVTAEVYNHGLTAAEAYRVQFLSGASGGEMTEFFRFESDQPLLPGESAPITLWWDVPEDFERHSILGLSAEKLDGWFEGDFIQSWASRSQIAPFRREPLYELKNITQTQTNEGLFATFTVENLGNAPSNPDDTVRIEFAGPYLTWQEYGFAGESDLVYASAPVGELAAGESREMTLELFIPAEAFTYYGFLDCAYSVWNGNMGRLSQNEPTKRITIHMPYGLTWGVDGADASRLNSGESYDVAADIFPRVRFDDAEVTLGTDDASIAYIADGKLVAASAGTTHLNIIIQPYGLQDSIPITVSGGAAPPDPVPPSYNPGGAAPGGEPERPVVASADGTIKIPYVSGEPLTIQFPTASVTLSAATMERLIAAPGDITVNSGIAENLTGMQLAQVKGYGSVIHAAVYTGGAAADVPMTLSIPYTIKEGEDPNTVCVWMLGDDGSLTNLDGTYSTETGLITFTAETHGFFVAGCDPVAQWVNVFRDVPENEWYYDAVAYVSHYGLFVGYDGKFTPSDPMTRAMFVTVLHNLEGKPERNGTASFGDVPSGIWYEKAVLWAAENGIVSGIGGGLYAPDSPISRQEMSLMLYNYAAHKGYDIPANREMPQFTDTDMIAAWAGPAVKALSEAGVFNGSNHAFMPTKTASRAEVAQTFKNFMRFV
jgi:hypothetical protein